jgi:hypothetical protein
MMMMMMMGIIKKLYETALTAFITLRMGTGAR